MQEIKQLFNEIGKNDITEFHNDLVFGGFIDSVDIISLVSLIEDKYKISIDFDEIVPENFYNFQTIMEMICKMQK
ncbi:acyl carrier protein [Campylobacter sp. US25a]|uniref:acyl carrier protein n=1 Tax=Campylobacter sp. US25a TaxID=2498119 RepID=UPI0010678360|nr:acyl carrier protein [Campylobacter sp. US25a]TEY07126.1 acyl carrier protein [Campylobacter sp. US25a]